MNAPDQGTHVSAGNLVLKTRIAVLRRNLEEVERALEAVQQRRTDLRQMVQFRREVVKVIGAISRAHESVKIAFDAQQTFDDEDNPEDPVAYDEVVTPLKWIASNLEALTKALNATDGPAKRLATPLPTEDVVTPSIGNLLQMEINQRFGGLEALEANVDQARLPDRDSSGAALTGMKEAWSEYVDKVYDSSEKLFGEYVELVGGLAIRDTGFDRGISRIADELVKPFSRDVGDHRWNSLAIPARQEALSLSASRIIRLGFPEWTIWTLPLAAHEFGHIFANWNEKIREYVEESYERQVCLADGFATYVMGPSYACAAILMRLDPRQAFSTEESSAPRLVAKRVAVILGVLEHVSRSGSRGRENLYGGITQRLKTEWANALSQTCTSGSLTPAEEQDVGRWITFLEDFVLSRQLMIEHWPTIEKWASQLSSGEVESIDVKGIIELRYVLNAAWRARVAVEPGEQDVGDADAIRDIADAAMKLWRRIEESGVGGGQARGARNAAANPSAGSQRRGVPVKQ